MAVSKKRHICPFDRPCSNDCSAVQPLDLFEFSDASSGVSWHKEMGLGESQFLKFHMSVGR